MPGNRIADLFFEIDERGTAALTRKLTTLDRVGGRTAFTLERVTRTVGRLGKMAMAGGAALAGLTAAGALRSLQVGGSFDQAMRNVWTLTDITKKRLDELSEGVRRVAREFPVSSQEAAVSLYDIVSAGVEVDHSLEMLETSLKAASAGLTDAQTAARGIIGVLNAYGLGASHAGEISDKLFTIVRYGVTTFGELAYNIGRLTAVAAPLGVSFEEIGAAYATLTGAGLNVEETVTAIRASLMQLAQPTGAMEKAIHKLGYASGVAMVRELGLAKSITAVYDYAQKANIPMTDLFTNVRAVTAVLPLTSSLADKFTLNLKRMADTAGATNAALEKQQGYLYLWGRLKTMFNDIFVSISDKLMPATQALIEKRLIPLADEVRAAIDQASDLPEAMRNVIELLKPEVAKAMGWLEQKMEEYTPVFVNIGMQAGEAVGRGFLAGFKAFYLKHPELVSGMAAGWAAGMALGHPYMGAIIGGLAGLGWEKTVGKGIRDLGDKTEKLIETLKDKVDQLTGHTDAAAGQVSEATMANTVVQRELTAATKELSSQMEPLYQAISNLSVAGAQPSPPLSGGSIAEMAGGLPTVLPVGPPTLWERLWGRLAQVWASLFAKEERKIAGFEQGLQVPHWAALLADQIGNLGSNIDNLGAAIKGMGAAAGAEIGSLVGSAVGFELGGPAGAAIGAAIGRVAGTIIGEFFIDALGQFYNWLVGAPTKHAASRYNMAVRPLSPQFTGQGLAIAGATAGGGPGAVKFGGLEIHIANLHGGDDREIERSLARVAQPLMDYWLRKQKQALEAAVTQRQLVEGTV